MYKHVPSILAVQPGFVLATSSYRKQTYMKDGIIHFYEYHHDNHNNLDVVGIPDGCIDIICEIDNNRVYAYVHGTVLSTRIHHHKDNTVYFGMRFFPGVLPPIFKVSMKELVGAKLPLEDIIIDTEVAKRLNATTDVNEWFSIFLNFYHNTLASYSLDKKFSSKDNLGSYVRDQIINSAGQISLESISFETQYSTRYLSSALNDKVGVCPKTFSKIIRFQNAVQLIDSDPHMNLTQIANVNGYYDQSHFIKDFSKFMGMSPKKYQKTIAEQNYTSRMKIESY